MTGTALPEPPHAISSAAANDEDDLLDDHPSSEKALNLGKYANCNDHVAPPRVADFEHEKTEHRQSINGNDARLDGNLSESEQINGEPPAKRRRLRETTPLSAASRKPKLESPPWKRIAADGPTSFTEGGRRKSGRINTVPLELQRGDKRVTRRSLHGGHSLPRARNTALNSHSTAQPSSFTKISKRSTSMTKLAPAAPIKPSAPPKTAPRRALAQESTPTMKVPLSEPSSPSSSSKPAVGTRRSLRHAPQSSEPDESLSPPPSRAPTRIKIKVPPKTTPLVHYGQVIKRERLGRNFEDFLARAGNIPVEEGGLLASEDDNPLSDEAARREALLILRIEKESEPGGLLSKNVCSAFVPEPVEEPPRQWAHADHLLRHLTNLRKLMIDEHRRHRATAKRCAVACEAEWRRRNPLPKTAKELEADEQELTRMRWRQVIKSLSGTWDNVRVEVNRQRLVAWEAEEQRRVKAALNQAVNLSEQKLQARQHHLSADELSIDMVGDEYEEDDGMEGEDDEQDSNTDDGDPVSEGDASSEQTSHEEDDDMSSSDDEEDKGSVVSDEGLSQAQLREKYANLPGIESESSNQGQRPAGAQDDSIEQPRDNESLSDDESIDMDDDTGNSEDEDESGIEGDNSDGELSADDEDGLLRLFFGKSELEKMKSTAANMEIGEQNGSMNIAGLVIPCDAETWMNGHSKDTSAEGVHPVPPTALIAGSSTVNRLNAVRDEPAVTLLRNSVLLTNPVKARLISVFHSEEPDPQATAEHQVARVLKRGAAQIEPRQDGDEHDVTMSDVPSYVEPAPQGTENGLAPTSAVNGGPGTPESEANSNPPSQSRSQSPRTSDTKPSDVDTLSSTEPAAAREAESRSGSPQPTPPRTEIPFLLRGTLREYQHYGLDWLAGLYANNTNGILADEMGLGKTIQTIALLAHLACSHEVWGPHLVIVPTSVMLNWEMEFKKWCPGFKILTYYGNIEERKRKRQGWTNDDVWNVCITSYQMVLQDQQVFRRRRWHYMILDEAHNIKNFRSQRWQTLLGFNTHSRLLLTGTPLQNNLTELWSLLYFLAPPENGEGGFADLQEFHNWFARPESQILESGREHLDDEARAIIAKLHKVLRPYLLRRLKADVEKQMPAKYEHVEFCRLSKRQRELYDGFLSRTDTRETLASGNYMSIINCLMQLRKVCNHPDLFVDRPIMTSFHMQRSVAADYGYTERLVRKILLAEKPMSTVSLGFLNLLPAEHENLSRSTSDRILQLSCQHILSELVEAQKTRVKNATTSWDPATVKSNLVFMESDARVERYEKLRQCRYLSAFRRQQRPIFGKDLVEFLTLDIPNRPFKQRPRLPRDIMGWFEEQSNILPNMVSTLEQRATSMEMTISKFACVTPAVVTGDLNPILLGRAGAEAFDDTNFKLAAPVKYAPYMPKEPPRDPWHVARMRLSIQFPDKRLIQYDCGKLQTLDKLLRRLQGGGHRALIFTQMTKVLDILEQFLNIHGHKYLRLDGATKVEQRQILTDRFNHDTRILCFILSTRSGGLGINLTGADTVIFYDQDWNPAMDKQCQDRCHRIGQTRDVHIYRLVSEHTIEANILRKASQKQMLDDVIIQEGEFTTDYFSKLSVRDVIGNNGEVFTNENDVAANSAMDRVLSGVESSDQREAGRVLEQAEDQEDVAAARVAEKETQQDDADFSEQRTTPPGSSALYNVRQGTPRDGEHVDVGKTEQFGRGVFAETSEDQPEAVAEVELNAFGEQMRTIDDHMLKYMAVALQGTPLELPKDKKKSKKKKGKDTRKR